MANMFSNIFGQQAEDNIPNEHHTDSMEERLIAMEQRIEAIEAKIKKMESIQVETEKTKDKENSLISLTPHDEPVCVVQPASKDTTNGVCIQPHASRYYLAAPNSDGTFGDISHREQIGKSIYQLTTHDDVSGSYFMLDTHDAIATAMISVSQFIKPVCKVVGSVGIFPRHIVTEEEGIASREGDLWRVTRKAIVRFE